MKNLLSFVYQAGSFADLLQKNGRASGNGRTAWTIAKNKACAALDIKDLEE